MADADAVGLPILFAAGATEAGRGGAARPGNAACSISPAAIAADRPVENRRIKGIDTTDPTLALRSGG